MHAELPLPVALTVEFLREQLGPVRRRVLEVGCGDGAVAAALGKAGHEVMALDADPEMVARARGRGVDARCVRWPDFEGAPADAIAFTQSLHHVAALDAALGRVVALLVPHGLLLLEELAHEAADERTLRWFARALRELDGDGLLRGDPALLANRLLHAPDPLPAWRDDHADGVHPFAAIEGGVALRFRPSLRVEVPYLFRCVAAAVPPGPEGEAAVLRVQREEERLVRRGEIAGLGRRLVARAPLAD